MFNTHVGTTDVVAHCYGQNDKLEDMILDLSQKIDITLTLKITKRLIAKYKCRINTY